MIIIEDSHRQMVGKCKPRLGSARGRAPFEKSSQIDYEMDSEDEVAEEQGEDLNSKQGSADGEDESGSENEDVPGFIVSDGHLSVSEYNFSDNEGDDDAKRAEIEARRSRLRTQTEKAPEHKQHSVLTKASDLEQFRIVPLQPFPLSLEKPVKESPAENQEILGLRVEFMRFVYASLESKVTLIEEFHGKHPTCSKKAVERTFTALFEKEKREGDLKSAYYASEAILEELCTESERQELA